jgi:hypothetical protein
VSAVNPLVAFYDIYGMKGVVFIYSSAPNTTRALTVGDGYKLLFVAKIKLDEHEKKVESLQERVKNTREQVAASNTVCNKTERVNSFNLCGPGWYVSR